MARYGYQYDGNGNRTQQTEHNGFGEEITTYTYDAAWNRVTETVTDLASDELLSNKTLAYNSRHQLTDISDSIEPAHNATFGYDANGNQISKVQSGNTTTFTYDARNHLREITQGGSTLGQFLYDYRGMRTEKQGERGIERYTHDDQAVLFQSDGNNTLTARYDYGPDRLLSLRAANSLPEYYLFDALNSPIALTRRDGTVSARYSYDAWGNTRQQSGTSFNRFGFTGHEHDQETGLIYAKARYYDPETARFLSQDPWSGDVSMPPSLHKYLYAYQNPTVYVDPDGWAALISDELQRVYAAADEERSFRRPSGAIQDVVRANDLGDHLKTFSRSSNWGGESYTYLDASGVRALRDVLAGSGGGDLPTAIIVREADESPSAAFSSARDKIGGHAPSSTMWELLRRLNRTDAGQPIDVSEAFDHSVARTWLRAEDHGTARFRDSV
ncbi:RHS repeat-associated core domain-containing protein, partial [Alcanivorax sp. JB21]